MVDFMRGEKKANHEILSEREREHKIGIGRKNHTFWLEDKHVEKMKVKKWRFWGKPCSIDL
ncbi:MAG: hypothetical protein Q8P67_29415, partial [archaeon]|nr:hypothetical protein [archaeon]